LSARTREKEQEAREQFATNWVEFEKQFRIEENNITIFPAEQELVDRLRSLKQDYHRRGREFFELPRSSPDLDTAYYGRKPEAGQAGDPGLYGRFREIKDVSGEILRINRENMEHARDEARATARKSLIGFGTALAALVALVIGIAWYLL